MKRHYAIFTALLFIVLAGAALGQNGHSGIASTYFDATQLLKDLQTLAADDMEGRSADRPAMAKVREYVEKRLKESGVKPIGGTHRQEFEIKSRRSEAVLKGVNFWGQIKGKMSPDRYIVITAHYDHDGIKNGEIYNGADDNASGTAALFAVASYFKKHRPNHSLIFVAFDAEEKGLVGARHFVANLPVAKDSILLNVNMDMIARNDKNELYAAGTYSYPQFRPALEKVQKTAKVKLLLGHDDPKTGRDDWTFQSDQGAFHAAKIPFIYFGVEDHEDYHKPTDDYEKIQPAFYVKSVETILAALETFDSELTK
ncbi:MAG TPA: M20/M25/M40 family metallo-hydrolase [Pyrinomonadaceae bacterium]